MSSKGEEHEKMHGSSAPNMNNSSSHLTSKVTERKKVYRSIFGPDASSESSDTDQSSYSTDTDGKKSSPIKTGEKSPIKSGVTNLPFNGEAKVDAEIKKDVDKRNEMQTNQNTVEECNTKVIENVGTSKAIQDDSISKADKTRNVQINEGLKLGEVIQMEGFLSPEEKEAVSQLALSQIAHVLDKRNSVEQDGNMETQLYTGPYGRIHSPFKKYSSFQGFPGGVKRSPRKMVGPAAKRTKLFHKDSGESSSSEASPIKHRTPPDKMITTTATGNEGSGDDSSDEDQWEIVDEELPTEIDQALEDKSSKFCLSVVNVKSIIHKIITNESVVEMVRKAVLEEIDEYELKYEPKMTRSKLKEIEAQGQIPLNWGLSPRKKRESPNFLEMELPEDEEEDEDFTPTMVQESDEDSESVLSSCYSDIGSPMPSTPQSMPSTPQSMPSTPTVISAQTVSTPTRADNDQSTPVDENVQSFLSPMGPPLQTTVPKSGGLGKKFQDAMERDKQRMEEEAELIASRTRSKFPMTDCSILDIEAGFVAPDITQDMYETCDDLDWKEFLSTLITFPDDTITNKLNITNEEEDTEDDPEYNFQEEIDTFEYDREDFRDDRAVKVSKKEMNMLLDDVLNNDEDYDNIDEQYKITIKTQSEKIVFNSNKKKQTQYQQSLISAIGEHERKQIDDQLRKHVQQLAQTYVLSQNGIAEHKPMGHTARFYLNELKNFADKSEIIYGTSAYRVCNLGEALCLVDDDSWQQQADSIPLDVKERIESLTFKHDSQFLPALSYKQMLVMWTSPVFIFPELLPHGGFFKQVDIKRDRARVKFLESEDNLLAMGVAQFSHLKKDAKDYIQRFMLPCKSRKQIEIRIKNLNAKVAKDNAVKFFKRYKILPRFPQHCPDFDISMMKSFKDSHYDWNELPWWCRFFCIDDSCFSNDSMRDQLDRQKEIKRRRRERLSASFSVSESDIAAMLTPPCSSASAPVTPHQNTDSSISGSSGSETGIILRPVKRKRPRRPSRKKLNMNKQKKSEMGVVGSFVPIPLPSSTVPKPQPSPLTICVLDNIQGLSQVPNTISPCLGSLPGNTSASCSQPTILVINKNAALQTQSFSQTVTFSSSMIYSQPSTPYTQMSSHVPLSMPLLSAESSRNESDVDTKELTFEDICRPIMEAELAEGGVEPDDLTEKELCRLYSENGSVFHVDGVKSDVIVNVVESVTENSTVLPNVESVTINSTGIPSVETVTINTKAIPNVETVAINSNNRPDNRSTSSPSTEVLNRSLSSDELNNSMCEVYSNEIPTTVLKDQSEMSNNDVETALENVATSLPIDDLKQEVAVQVETSATPVEGQKRDESEGTNYSLMECRCTPTQELNSQTSGYTEMTPKQSRSSSDMSSSEKTPKSSLEVVASLAPYFISPIHSDGSLQYSLEKTPSKRKLPTLAPKSVSPSQRSVPISFSDLRSPPRQKISPSPRKKHLQQQVKTILPKGFVMSSFDTSPAKKAASSLVDKAKHLVNSSPKGFCKILPRPPNQTVSKRGTVLSRWKKRRSAKSILNMNKQDNTKESGIDTQSEDMSDNVNEEVNENNQTGDEDDRCGDTESDYTQSEDGNETQGTDGEDVDTQGTDDGEGTLGTDGDSQDSQEEDNHIADLMTASTTIGFVPTRESLHSGSRLRRKDRNRALTLALLEPDIVEADPQRDLRDTLFAQAYIHKVKKVLKDDVDKLEKFLRLMYHFSQEGTSPVMLYNDLQELFSNQPELISDFASFLQADQALECGCYKAYQEFNNARIFLRKLEIYFTKNPNQLQKVMRTFSRWYKKPGRKESDLREQIEPMLKGQKLLLEEFSMFFPSERPSESMMDDFEEVDLDDSGENEDKDTSFEEINLLDMEEVYGTKRCPCECHDAGDDTYRKRKKHCYRCCLTVIDGELVFKVNKSTIKKINVTYGPPVKLSTLIDKDQSETTRQEVVCNKTTSQEPNSTESNALETDVREPVNMDWFLDQETAEKENIEHFNEETSAEKDGAQRKAKGKSSPSKESFLQRISKLSRNQPQEKQTRLSSVIKGKSLSPKLKGEQPCEISQGDISKQQQSMEPMDVDEVNESEKDAKGSTSVEENNSETMEVMSLQIETAHPLSKKNLNDLSSNGIIIDNEQTSSERYIGDKEEMVSNKSEKKLVPEELGQTDENVKGTSDILAAAFTNALNTEVSMDSLCFPFNMSGDNKTEFTDAANIKLKKSLHDLQNKSDMTVNVENTIRPTVLTCEVSNSVPVFAPAGQNNLHVSNDSSFQKVPSSENINPKSKEIEAKDSVNIPEKVKNSVNDGKEEGIGKSVPSELSKVDYVLEASKSPPFSPFSPFSPFAQEIQSITSAQSPLAAVQSPGVTRSLSSSGKVRRITPIPIKGSEEKTNSQSSFQTAVENSPVIRDVPVVSSPYENIESKGGKSIDNLTNNSSNSQDNSQGFLSKVRNTLNGESGSDSQKHESSSQKSNSNSAGTSSSQTSNSEPGFTSIVINQPDIFSENANVGFPKVSQSSTNSVLSHSGILSEESLFHCLSKPQFSETIPTVSNLTNILHALDGHSQGYLLNGHGSVDDGKTHSDCARNNTENIDVNLGNENQKENIASDSNFANIKSTGGEKVKEDVGKGNDSLSESGSGDSGEGQNLYPQSSISIENIERLKTGLFKVSTLSDSDTSVMSSPSVTNAHDKQSVPTVVSQDRNQISGDKSDLRESIVRKEENSNKVGSSMQELAAEPAIIVTKYDKGKVIDSGNDSVNETEVQDKKKKRKMSRREMRRSLQGKGMEKPENTVDMIAVNEDEEKFENNANATNEQTIIVNRKDQEGEVNCKEEIVTVNVNADNVHIEVDLNNELDLGCDRSESVKEVSNESGIVNRLEVIKTEEPDITDSAGMSDVQSISDTVSEASSRGNKKAKRKKNKHKSDKDKDKHRKKKRRKEHHDSDSTPKTDKKKKKKSKRKEEGEKLEVSKSVVEKVTTGRVEKESKGDKRVAVSKGVQGTNEEVPTNGPEDNREEEPEWSKETDKTILENCKVHGIKEKTFIRIAKEIGNVSAKQVRQRFAHLYQMIFGIPFGEKASE